MKGLILVGFLVPTVVLFYFLVAWIIKNVIKD
jgi:hypothetical protein